MSHSDSISRFRLISLLIVSLMVFTSVTAIGQTASHTRDPQKNFAPAGAFSLGDFESINTTNGNLILRYTLGQLPPGRNGMRGGFYLQYNSKLYETFIGEALDISGQISQQNLLRDSGEAGWRLRFRHELLVTNRNNEIDGGYEQAAANACNSQGSSSEQNELATYTWKVRIRFPDGAEHLFRPSGYADARGDGYFNVDTFGTVRVYGCAKPPGSQGCSCSATQSTDPNPRMAYYSADGSYLRLIVERNQDWTLYYPDGSKITNQGAVQRVYDRNGNYYEIVNNTITDNFGRSTTLTYDAATGDDLITQTGVSGTPLVWRIKWKTVSIINKGYSSTAAGGQQQGNTSIQQWTADYLVVDKIILPTQLGNLSYTFNYNTSTGWAEVSSVVMPADVSETPPQVAYQYSYPGGLANGLPKCTNILRGHTSTKTLTWWAQTDGATSAVTETWLYDIGNTVTTITTPDGGVTTELHGDTSYPAPDGGLLKRVERPDGTKTERIYALNPQPWLGVLPPPLPERNAFVKTEFTTIKNAGGTYVKTAIKDFAYDKNGNVLQVTEYDWVDYSLVPKDGSGLPTGIPGGATVKRVTLNTYNNPTPDSSTPGSHANAYWNVAPSGGYTTLTLNAIASKEIRATAAGAVQARTEFTYDNPATTANVTVTRSWDSTKGAVTTPLTGGNSIATTNQYSTYSNGATGKLIKTFDANNVATAFTYGDIGNGVTDLYVTKTIVAETTSVARTSENKYDFHTGVVTEAKDTDNNVVTQTTLDVFGRPTLVKEAVGTPSERRTATEYSDTMRRVITRSDLNTAGDGKLVSIQHYDQLDRLRLSRSLEDSTTQDPYNEQHGIKVQTRYAYSGSNSYEIVSAAYRAATSGAAGGEAEMAWRRIKNDQGGKIIELETFAGATPPAPWGNNTTSTGKVTTAYDAEFTTVTDQMNRSRRSMVDGIGRLIRVDEPDATNGGLGTTASPVQPTNYTYSALDKLTQTVQGGQTRTFNYSSLSRLLSATNPENGTVSYAYDNNGNLLTKTDARNITATHTYDPLNRNTTISYSGGASPTIQRYYDGAVKGKGRLWYSLSYNVHPTSGQLAYSYTIVDSYDELGRAKTGSQNFLTNNGATWMSYPISRTFDIAGNVKTQSYPSTRSTTYNYDNAGRISSFSGNIGDGVSRTYANEFLFNAQGQIKRERFGTTTALYHNIHYNSRGQAVDIRLGTSSADEWTWNRGALITYFSNQARSAGNAFLNANDNNGNVTMQEHYVPMDDAYSSYAIPLRDTYEYDALNRVTQANGVQRTTGGAWPSVYAQHYSYDRWGNRWINSAGTWGANIFNTVILPNSANNRLNGMSYDSAGNTTTDNITGGGARTYDADNRMTSAQSGGTWNYYVYDADGKRVRRIVNGIETWHVYGFSGELLAEYSVNGATGSPLKEYANGGQTMIVGDATNVRWTVADALGTPRIVADKTGSLSGITRHDYLPFGEELFVGLGNGSIRTTGMGYANSGTPDGIRKKFTGYERDDETGLDYAQARYYSSKQGRFTSPDEFTGGPDELYDFADVASENPMIYAELDEPQSLNKYQYCFNNPLALVDPDGHKSWKDWARTVVEVATYVPGPIGTVASVVQAVDKLAQGDYAGAASSALGAAPGAKLLRAGVRAVDKLTDGARVLDKLNDTRKQGTAIKAAGNACGLCFTAGTEVSTPDGLKKIEDIRVGDRVTTTGINKDRPDGWTAVDPKQWRVVKLLMPDPKGSEDVYEIELLRSLEWIRKVGAAPRRFIEIELTEMGLSGLAKVETITACPPIKAGLGRVVLMTVTHMDSGVMEIEFDGLKKALEPTVSHPLFSADRNDWAPAGLLNVGERIKTRTGNAQIKAIHWKKGEHRVYNFEVEADQAYFVSSLELLSHNTGGCGGYLIRRGQKAESAKQLGEQAAKAEANGFPHGVSTRLKPRVSGTDKQSKSALKSDVEKVFEVKQTGADPKHHTVILPKPVTPEVADKFNKLFKPLE